MPRNLPRNIDQDRTELFTVVGAPYVAEHHDDGHSHYRKASDDPVSAAGVAGVWLAFYVLIAGVAVLGQGGASKAIRVASRLLK